MFFLKALPTQRMLQTYRERYPGMDMRAVSEALVLLRRGSLLMRALDAYFSTHGLSQTRFLVLIVIDREPETDGLLASEIADRLDISRPVVTETVTALRRAGLLDSVPVPEDGRARRIMLTPNGQAVLADLLPGYFAVIADFMAGTGDARDPPATLTRTANHYPRRERDDATRSRMNVEDALAAGVAGEPTGCVSRRQRLPSRCARPPHHPHHRGHAGGDGSALSGREGGSVRADRAGLTLPD